MDRRRPPQHRPKTQILVYCGGDRSEPAYLEGLKATLGERPYVVDVRSRGKVAPQRLVELAARHAAGRATYDEVWCVVDADHFDIAAAHRLAGQRDVELVVSVPCFELWLLLHHEDHRAHLADCTAATARLRKHVPGYAKRLDFADFAAGVPAAIERAKALDEDRSPFTGCWRLVQRLLDEE